jgi:methyl-accepting chemotaxis protein
VRKLAEQSEQAAGQITGIIAEIQKQTENAVLSMNNGATEVVKGTEVVSENGRRFQRIHTQVEGLNRKIQEISAASQELAASSEQVTRSVEEILQITDQTAEGTGTISAAAEEQSASMGEIVTSSRSLSQMAQDLENKVRRFEI